MPCRFSEADNDAAESSASTESLLDMPWGGRDWDMSVKAPQQSCYLSELAFIYLIR